VSLRLIRIGAIHELPLHIIILRNFYRRIFKNKWYRMPISRVQDAKTSLRIITGKPGILRKPLSLVINWLQLTDKAVAA